MFPRSASSKGGGGVYRRTAERVLAEGYDAGSDRAGETVLRRRDAARELARERDLRFLDVVRIHAFERLLFVGCGDGWIAEEAWRRGLRVYVCGLDASPDLIAHAAALRGLPGKLDFQTWDERRLPFANGSFERVFSIFALRRAPDAATVLEEMRRVLAPGGELCLLERAESSDGPRGDAAPAFAAALRRVGFGGVEDLLWSEGPREAGDDGAQAVVVRARR